MFIDFIQSNLNVASVHWNMGCQRTHRTARCLEYCRLSDLLLAQCHGGGNDRLYVLVNDIVSSTNECAQFSRISMCIPSISDGSHCPRGEPSFVNSIVVGISNCLFSFVSGFAVFASLGHLAYIEGVDISELEYGGFSLTFGA